MDEYQYLTLKAFRGGISSEEDKGPRGSFKFGRGLNIHGVRDSLKCNQKLTKDSSTTVTDLPLAMIPGTDGNKYAFGDTGKIYRKTGSTWSLVHTDADGKITGAVEFKSTSGTYILYATRTKLKKITLANAGATWAGNVSDAGTFTHANANTNHSMKVAIGSVMITDGPYLAMYDYEDAFNPIALELLPDNWANTILERSTETTDRLIMGTVGNGLPFGKFITWDGIQDSWLANKSAQGNGVRATEFLEGGVMAQVGDNGILKYWNFAETYPLKRIPNTANARPNGIAEYNTMPHIGMNGGSANGVYSVGRIDKNDPIALNLEYVPSHGKLTGTEIGSLMSDGTDLYVAWKDGSTYGIDKTDQTLKATAVYESLEMDMGKPQVDKTFNFVKVITKPLPAGAKVSFKYKTTVEPNWVETETSSGEDELDTTGATKIIFNMEGQGEIIETQLTLTPNGNNGPEVLSATIYFNDDNTI